MTRIQCKLKLASRLWVRGANLLLLLLLPLLPLVAALDGVDVHCSALPHEQRKPIDPAPTAATVGVAAQSVQIVEGVHEDRPQFIVYTEQATWFYDRAGGGFSRLVDRDGRDWIAFSKRPLTDFPAAAAAGFRGIPNAVFVGPDRGAGHPGFDQCTSELTAPNQIRTRSFSGRWQWSWTFTATTARFVMEQTDPEHPWWFLYEGPVAGRFAPTEQYWGTDTGGPHHDVPDLRNQRFGQWRWAYFGDPSLPRTLFVAQHQPDALDDTFWYLGSTDGGAATAPDGMVVFGFGRGPGTQPLFRGSGQCFTIGLLEIGVTSPADHGELGARIEAAFLGRANEPTEWAVEAFKPPDTAFPSGSVCLVPHNSDVTIHQVTVEPLGPSSEGQPTIEQHPAMP